LVKLGISEEIEQICKVEDKVAGLSLNYVFLWDLENKKEEKL